MKGKTVEVSPEVAAEIYRLKGLVLEQAEEIERLEKKIVSRCQYHRKKDAHRCPYVRAGCMDWDLCKKHFYDCGKEWVEAEALK